MPINVINTEDFAELRQNFGYYVDKTRFLVDFLQDPTNAGRFRSPAKATLFTRPRRFGKTLFMSMLAEFFDIRKQGDGKKLFDGLAVSANVNLCQEWMNQYPVISLTLKDVNRRSYELALVEIHALVRKFCNNHKYLLSSERVADDDKSNMEKCLADTIDESALGRSLFALTSALSSYYSKPAIVLIDEYDVPVAKSAEKGYYDEMIEFMRSFLSPALKSNPCLNFAILTGALRITKESIFTGLNNLRCFDISSPDYEDIFGFTQNEVDKMLADAGCEDRRDIIKEWYDGYQFGERSDMYCPWSITNYLYDLQKRPRDPQAYWVSTSGNALTRDFAKRLPDGAKVHENFAILLGGDPIAVTLNPCMNYVDIFTDTDNFWTLLYLTGYLTMARDPDLFQVDTNADESLLVIPNREVREVFQKELKALLKDILPKNLRTALYEALWKQDAAELEKLLTVMLEGCSVHDTKEAWYHGMMYGILLPKNERTNSNRESGHGRYDLYLPDKQNSRAMVLEFKRTTSEGKLEAGVREALTQIEEKKYDQRPRKEGYKRILRVGIAFFGKSVKVGFEEVRV